jgi:hypothetical protein
MTTQKQYLESLRKIEDEYTKLDDEGKLTSIESSDVFDSIQTVRLFVKNKLDYLNY